MQVRLNRNGWHRKLQEWIFGTDATRFGSLCPYFWFTIFCIFATPVVGLFRIAIAIFSFLADCLEKHVYIPLERKQAEELTEEKLFYMYIQVRMTKGFEKREAKMDKLSSLAKQKFGKKGSNFDWWKMSQKLSKRYDIYLREQEIYLQKKKEVSPEVQKIRATRKEILDSQILRIVKITRLVTPTLLVAASLAIIYYGAIFLNSLEYTTWMKVGEMALLIVAILVGLATVAGIAFLIAKSPLSGQAGDAIAKGFGSFFKRVGEKFSNAFEIFFDYAKAFKQDYCPMIDWKDDK